MLTKEGFKAYRTDVENALAAVADKYNVDIKAENIKYDSDSFTLQLKATMKEVNGKAYEQAQFEKYCAFYGFKPSDYKKRFLYNGSIYTLIGFNKRAKKMPVIALSEDGRTYSFAISLIKDLKE